MGPNAVDSGPKKALKLRLKTKLEGKACSGCVKRGVSFRREKTDLESV